MADNIINQLNPMDEKLFNDMLDKYISDNERIFFEQMRYKQEHIYTSANDLVFHESSNEDALYLIRIDFDEYVLGYAGKDRKCDEIHKQSLSEILSMNLKEAGFSDKNESLIDWLRKRDYNCVVYDQNYDWL